MTNRIFTIIAILFIAGGAFCAGIIAQDDGWAQTMLAALFIAIGAAWCWHVASRLDWWEGDRDEFRPKYS